MTRTQDDAEAVYRDLRRLHEVLYLPGDPLRDHVATVIDVGEYELALENFAWHLLESGRTCPADLLPAFRDVAMRLNTLDSSLTRYVLEGRRSLPPKDELPPY